MSRYALRSNSLSDLQVVDERAVIADFFLAARARAAAQDARQASQQQRQVP